MDTLKTNLYCVSGQRYKTRGQFQKSKCLHLGTKFWCFKAKYQFLESLLAFKNAKKQAFTLLILVFRMPKIEAFQTPKNKHLKCL